MGLDRLDEVTIGEPCKVDGCSTVCVEGEDRCHDHSVNRMIEGLFAPGENCRFGGIDCTIQATHSNQHDVPMCENCYNVWVRIQRGNAVNQLYRSPYSAEVRYVTGDQQPMGQAQAPYMTGESPSGRHSNFDRLLPTVEPYYEDGPVCPGYPDPDAGLSVPCGAPAECSQILHGQTVSMCYRRAEIVQERFHRIDSPAGATFGHAIASGVIRSALGIPPMRRDEGEETE